MSFPLHYTWDGSVFTPTPRFAERARKQFEVGGRYPLVVHEERSGVSHRQYFAAVHEGWNQLPESIAHRWPSSEHLRKWCLVRAGFADEQSTVCMSDEQATEIAAFVRPLDGYAVITVKGPVVTVYRAKSQSHRAMNKAEFQASKQAVLDLIADLCSIDADTLSSNANRAA